MSMILLNGLNAIATRSGQPETPAESSQNHADGIYGRNQERKPATSQFNDLARRQGPGVPHVFPDRHWKKTSSHQSSIENR